MVCIGNCADTLFYFRWVFVSKDNKLSQWGLTVKLLSMVKQNERFIKARCRGLGRISFGCPEFWAATNAKSSHLLCSYNISWLIIIYPHFWSVLLASRQDNSVCSINGEPRAWQEEHESQVMMMLWQSALLTLSSFSSEYWSLPPHPCRDGLRSNKIYF